MPENILHTPIYQQTWVVLLMLALFVFFVLAYIRSHNWLISLYENFSKMRAFNQSAIKRTAEEQQSRLLMTIFSIATISLYISIYASENTDIDFLMFVKLFVLFLCFLLIKERIARFIGFVFFRKDVVALAIEQYFNLLFLFATILYPLLILGCFGLENTHSVVLDTIAVIFLILSILSFIILLFQFFYRNILDSLHILLYLCTLEFLPYFGLYYACDWVIYGL